MNRRDRLVLPALLTGLAAAAVLTADSAHAATAACTAAQIVAADSGCPSTGPCSITKVFDVGTGCVLDFGTRNVTLAGSGELRIGPGAVTLKAHDVTVAGMVDGTTATVGGSFNVQASGDILINYQSTGKIVVNGAGQGGSILLEAGGNITVAGQLKASNDSITASGGDITLRAGGNIVTAATSIIDPKGGLQADGGLLDLTAGGWVDIGSQIDITGWDGGSIEIDAGENVILRAQLVVTGAGDAGSGGTVDIVAGADVEINAQIKNMGTGSAIDSGGGDGGSVFIESSFGSIIVRNEINAKSGPPDGLGGDIELFARDSIDIQSTAQLIADGGGGQSDGGSIFLDANHDIMVNGLLSALAGDSGGDIELAAGRDVMVAAKLDGRATTPGGYGGVVTIEAGVLAPGTLTIASTVDVSGPGCDTFGFCALGGDIDLAACAVTVEAGALLDAMAPGSDGSGGTIFVTGRNQITIHGTLDSTGGTGPLNGENRLFHRLDNAPLIDGAIVPAPIVIPRSQCTGAPGDTLNCLVPCPTCGNGVTEFPETCDTPGPLASCDGCSVFCRLENCDDQSLCTIDSCDPALGCRHQLAPSGTVCRPAAGDCDRQETCTGTSPSCPANTFLPGSTVCRSSTGPCDPAESCTGSAALCPADALHSAGTPCRPASGACDVAESCSGTSPACPGDALEPSGTVCRPASGACDAAESCSGTSPACPGDAVEPSGTVCRPVAGDCDRQETCTGASPTCPADSFAPGSAVCRASTGACDRAETCTGAGPVCPADTFHAAGTTCRPVAGDCDLEENCTGTSPVCPGDTLVSGGTICRPAASDCDANETCTGVSPTCPPDAFEPGGAACDDGDVCTIDDACDGTGSCIGDPATCGDGVVQAACGEACDDGGTLGGDGCSGGCTVEQCFACAGEPSACAPETGASCDDGDVCTNGDSCDASGLCRGEERPRTSCRKPLEAGKAALSFKDRSADKADQAVFKWIKGPETSKIEFGNPVSSGGTSYTLCVYDEVAGTPSLVLKLTAPAGSRCRNFRPCWKPGNTGFKYSDRDASVGGLQTLQLKAGGPGKAKVQLKAKGENLTLPTLPLAQDTVVTAQIVGSNGLCFDTVFSAPAKQNDAESFKAKGD